jgi:hypothetical protein
MTQWLMSSLLGMELAIIASGPAPSVQSPWLAVLFVLTAFAACRAAMGREAPTVADQASPPERKRETRVRGEVRTFAGPRDRRA